MASPPEDSTTGLEALSDRGLAVSMTECRLAAQCNRERSILDRMLDAAACELAMQDHIQEGAIYFQSTIIFDITHLPELRHEMVDSGACRSDHGSQSFLAELGK